MRHPKVGDCIDVNFENHHVSGVVIEIEEVWFGNDEYMTAMIENSWVNYTKAQSIRFLSPGGGDE